MATDLQLEMQLSCPTEMQHARTHALTKTLTPVSQQEVPTVTRRGATKTDVDEGLENSPHVRHLAANLAEHYLAVAGKPYRTLCGLIRTPPRANMQRDEDELSPMEKCAVCAVLRGPL